MTMFRTGLSIASSAAMIAISAAATTAPAFAQAEEGKIHCYGINTCKGQSDCKTAKNECKGMNACKGQGFKELTVKACTAAGGSLTAPK